MEKKTFRLRAEDIRPIAEGHGACFASDRITVDGARVGYMYREEAHSPGDGGWRFFAGDESQDYADTAEHFQMYDVNTIANYDPEIVPLLGHAPGAAFARNELGVLVAVPFETAGD